MPIRNLLTNFSKGELSPRVEGRPDLAAYFEGGKKIENFLLLRQGGLDARPGLRFIAEVRDSSKDTILIPFVASVDAAYQIEIGDGYMRFLKNKALIMDGGVPVEISSPYAEADLRDIHFTQSVDVLYLFNSNVPQQMLSRLSDTSWVLNDQKSMPPPSFEDDTDISGGTTTLTPGAISGTNVIFTASAAVFLAGDVGRHIIFGASRAIITAFGASAGDASSPNDHVRADILDNFPNTSAIPAGEWFLRFSPQATLDPDRKEPVGTKVTLVAGVNSFRVDDVGKYITIYGGLVRITAFTSVTTVVGEILAVMEGTNDTNPAAAPAGAWTLEVGSWDSQRGFPRSGEFIQGRLGQLSTPAQKTAFWLSASDAYDNYAIGAAADRAIDYTVAARQLNRLEWMVDWGDLFIGSASGILKVTSGREDEPLGGDKTPLVRNIPPIGSGSIQAIVLENRVLFVDRSYQKIVTVQFNIEQDGHDTIELTGPAEHITGSGIRRGPLGLSTAPDPRIYFVREDGTLVALTFFIREKVVGFTRLVTDGTFEACTVIPSPTGPDQVWCIVKRTINGATKRYIEMFEANDERITNGRAWTSLHNDCATVYNGVATTVITGLGHLEGKTVRVVMGKGVPIITTVSGAQITLPSSETVAEIGIAYIPEVITMRPAIQNAIIEGLPRSWNDLFVRLLNSLGGKINGESLQYPAGPLDAPVLFTGDRDITGSGWDTDGRITITQDAPFPMTLLAVFGTLEIGGNV